jgi:thioredoxin reductase (NADPH)
MTQTASPDFVDLAIIGAGPVGLFAAYYAGLRQMSVKILDSLDVLGGQLVTLYPEKYIYDVAGFPRVLAKDLVGNLTEQGMQYGAVACLGEQVLEVLDLPEGGFLVKTSQREHRARAVVITAGMGSFTPKKLPIPTTKAGGFTTSSRIWNSSAPSACWSSAGGTAPWTGPTCCTRWMRRSP